MQLTIYTKLSDFKKINFNTVFKDIPHKSFELNDPHPPPQNPLTQGSTSPLARSPEASKNQAGLVHTVRSVVHGRVKSCRLFFNIP